MHPISFTSSFSDLEAAGNLEAMDDIEQNQRSIITGLWGVSPVGLFVMDLLGVKLSLGVGGGSAPWNKQFNERENKSLSRVSDWSKD